VTAEGGVAEYIAALLASERLNHRICCHRVIPPRPAEYAEPGRPLSKAVRELLAARGVDKLYSHQAKCVSLARAGRHVAAATPTASGKTLAYTLPVLEEILANPDSRALFLFPLKALAQDQLRAFNELTASLPKTVRPSIAVYDGDTTPHQRGKLRVSPPNVLITNPEMLHLAILPHQETWATFLAGLTHVVVDEAHTYRGVMGSHMAHVFRRLNRVCARFGASPAYLFSSATIGNPGELAQLLTGLPVTVVGESGAPAGARHFLFVNPMEGTAHTAILLLKAALSRGLRTIVYSQSRKMTELIALWAAQKAGPMAARISAYRSGFLPEERRDIEARMAAGDLLAVVTTSALELGIDIGRLDLCILAGYPGTVMSTWQRGGRVGRALRESAVILVAGEDALDQYFMRHPDDFFSRPPEDAVINPDNPVICARHLECAAAEYALRPDEPYLASAVAKEQTERLLQQGRLLWDAGGERIHAGRKLPHRDVDLRGAGGRYHIETQDGRSIGFVDEHRAFKETHPGAVYLHRGESYVVEEFSLAERRVRAAAQKVDYYTRTRGHKTTEILEITAQGLAFGARVGFGRLKVTETITGYERRKTRGGQLLNIVPLSLPPLTFETEGLWYEIPRLVQDEAERRLFHFMGGIHAMEHAAIGILPLLVMADRNDFGGISTPLHPQLGRAAVFIYDGAPGGVGLTRQAFARAGELLTSTQRAIVDCPCENGCPSCVHSPKCGSGNRPIDKMAARFLLEEVVRNVPETTAPFDIALPEDVPAPRRDEPSAAPHPKPKPPKRFAVFDLETQLSAQEVGGWHNARKMRVSVGVVYDSALDDFLVFKENQIDALIEALAQADLVVGFNVNRFDYEVLRGYGDFNFSSLNTLDLLDHIRERIGVRLSLDTLAQATLNAGKTADGLMALTWWKQGRLEDITRYCRADVALTRDLYLYGRENGYLLYRNKAEHLVRCPVSWA